MLVQRGLSLLGVDHLFLLELVLHTAILINKLLIVLERIGV